MTVPASPRKSGPYPGNDVATAFAFDFKVFTEEDVKVIRAVTATGVETILTLDSDYSVTLNADQEEDPGGSVTYPLSGDELPAAQTLTITGNLEYKQATDLPDGGAFNASNVEAALDYQNILIQQLSEEVGRAVKVTASSDSDPAELVADLFEAAGEAAASAGAAAASAGAASGDAAAVAANVLVVEDAVDDAEGYAAAAQAAAETATAAALDTPLTGLSLLTNAAITAGDTILSAFGKVQKQITDLIAVVAGKASAGANSSITSLSGLTTPLSRAQGGTGSDTSKTLVQTIHSASTAVATGSTTIPFDNTKPQSGEGDQYLSAAITPKNVANELEISVLVQVSSSANAFLIAALFQDAVADALDSGFQYALVTEARQIQLFYKMVAGTTSATTFKVRAGASAAGTTTFNGSAGSAVLGGTLTSHITVREYTP